MDLRIIPDALIAKKLHHLNLNWGTFGLINIGLENYFFKI